MKDLSIYFKPIAPIEDFTSTELGAKIVHLDGSGNESIKKNALAIVFVGEYRNSTIEFSGDTNQLILDKINKLKLGDWDSVIYNLGEILPGNTAEDTFSALKEVVFELVKHDVCPIVIGGSQDLTLALYQAYDKLEQTVNLLSVDSHFDLGDPEAPIHSEGWLNKIILHKPNFLFNCTNIGYQSYYVNTEEIELFSKMYFDTYRLGEYYTDSTIVEPLVRNTDILSFDLDAIRASDYEGNSKASPHGFYGEDACRIMRYAGLSDKLSSVGIFNFNASSDKTDQSANLVAQMVWYFIEGYNQRKGDYPKCTKKNYIKYHVNIDEFKDEILFYKSNKSGRWWIEVPYPNSDRLKFQRHLLVPCTYDVYQQALNNEMPALWWKTYQKLI